MAMTTEERKESVKLANVKWRERNKENERLRVAKYRLENKEKSKKASNKWRLENKDKAYVSTLKWKEKNKAKNLSLNATYRAKKFGATIYMTKEDKAKIDELYVIASDASKLFGYDWAVDHIVPLAKGGIHNLANLQVVPAKWNRIKSASNSDLYWG